MDARQRNGYLLGLLGVAIFALTLPMTRLAVGDASRPQLPPGFVTAGRAAAAGLASIVFLLVVHAVAHLRRRRAAMPVQLPGARLPRSQLPAAAAASSVPCARQLPALLVCAAGTVVGFPLFLALALRQVDAVHAAVVTGVLPLATSVVAAVALGQRASAGFWICAAAGCALVLAFAAWSSGSGRLVPADGLLLASVASAAVGYVAGARVAAELPAERVICWVLVLALPLTLPVAVWLWPAEPASTAAWLGFGYVSLFSMWLGFFAWYRGLALGGVLRVSQVQLLQPFLALLFAAWILGERLDAPTLLFAAAVLALVLAGRKL